MSSIYSRAMRSILSKTRKRTAIWLFACVLTTPLALSTAHAQLDSGGDPIGDVGGLLGVTWANHDAGSHVAWGLTSHYYVLPNLNVGLYYERFTNQTTVLSAGGTQFTTSYNFIAAEANYLLTGIINGAYVGGKFGWAITSVNLPNVNDANNVVFGPAVGYDYMLGGGVSVGGQFNILWRTGSPFLTDPNLLAVLKYNFG